MSKPHRVWSADRSLRKSLTASSLKELIKKGREKLGMKTSNILVVLETDGTEVDDEDYFAFLDANTTFLFLEEGERWRPVWDKGEDETDFQAVSPGDLPEGVHVTVSLKDTAAVLRQDITRLVTLTRDQLQGVAEASTDVMMQLLGCSELDGLNIQLKCQEYLDDQAQARDAIGLLQLLKDAPGATSEATDAVDQPTKRAKVE